MNNPILLDNTVLTNLALVDQVELVTDLWTAGVCTTPAAWGEYQRGVESELLPPDAWEDLPLLTLTEQEATFAATLLPRLGAGERACLAVAVHRQGLLVSDDLDARRTARRHHVPVTGTVGILVSCVQCGRLSYEQAETLLTEMVRLGYRSPVTSLALLLDE